MQGMGTRGWERVRESSAFPKADARGSKSVQGGAPPKEAAAPPLALALPLALAAHFVLDMAADTQGPLKACWAPLLLVSIVFFAWLKDKIERDDESEASKARSRQRPEVEMTDVTPSPLALARNAATIAEPV